MRMRPFALLAGLFTITAVALCEEHSRPCSSLPKDEIARLNPLVRSRFGIDQTATLDISETGLGPNCFHKLHFVARAADLRRVFDRFLFLAPDRQTLVTDAFDTAFHPSKDRDAQLVRIADHLVQDHRPGVSGSENAPITITVFSDFQCPYSKDAANVLNSALNSDSAIKLIYRYFPLPTHDWAEDAALAVACAQQQSSIAFRIAHDAIFANQAIMSRTDVNGTVRKAISDLASLDLSKYDACVSKRGSASMVEADLELADSLGVRSTPSVFIGGFRLNGIVSPEQIRTLVRELRADSESEKRSAIVDGKLQLQ